MFNERGFAMQYKPTPVALAVAIAMLGAAAPAYAADAPAAQPEVKAEEVKVTGIRASKQKSLSVKRNAASNVEVVTAEDVGKMPDKNVADSLQRLPGVTISTSVAGSGGFDENDRVSLRGTSPSLTQTLINGHALSSGDWFVLDQVGGAVGRSASYSLLPSDIVGQVVVKKSPTADIPEGGVAGTVDILTRKPLDFAKPFSVDVNLQAVHSTLAGETDPQVNILANWKNAANTFGVMVQAFSEKRHLRRDGQELLQWSQISPTSAMAIADPKLANVWYPNLIGSALFEQERKREGGLIDIQAKLSDALTLDATYFRSKLNATNYNRNWMTWMAGSGAFGGGNLPDSYTIHNGTLTSAKFSPKLKPDGTPHQYAIVDNIYRPGSYAKTEFFDIDAKFRATDNLTFKGKFGSTKGTGATPEQAVFEGDVFGTGLDYSLNGINAPATVKLVGGNPSSFAGTRLDWIFGFSPASTLDKERYAQFDGEYKLQDSVLTQLKFGARATDHDRSAYAVSQGPNWAADPFAEANLPSWGGQTYPSDFGNALGGNFPKNVWMLDPEVLRQWGEKFSNRSTERTYYPDMFDLTEKTTAIYVSGDLEGEDWSGNLGIRLVKTDGSVNNYQIVPTNTGGLPSFPWGGFVSQKKIENDYTDYLPSANFKFDLSSDLVARLGVSRTMTRPDFGALAGTVSLTDSRYPTNTSGQPDTTGNVGTNIGNGGNPFLKPVRSNNFDASLQWYFAPRSLLSAGLYHMDLESYIGYGQYTAQFQNSSKSEQVGKAVFENYTITAPINVSGTITGIELAYQQPIGNGFGIDGNFTYADASQDFGTCATSATNTSSKPCDLVGASKITWNAGAFYERGGFNARVGYSWRSSFLAAQDRGTPLYQDDVGVLSAAINYAINDNITISFDAQNLNNPVLKNYVYNPDQPRSFYNNGRQYYLGLRMKY